MIEHKWWETSKLTHVSFLCFCSSSEEILDKIQARGFTISRLKDTVLSREMAEEFYKEHRDKPFFSQLVDYMCRWVLTKHEDQKMYS